MRVVWVVLVLSSLGLAGCVDEPAPDAVPTGGQKVGETLAPDDPLSAYTWNGTSLIYDELEPPTPAVGTAWTYAAGGVWALTDTMTIVVAKNDAGETIFGAASQDELLNTAIWQQYWYGPMKDLNQRDIEAKLFDWPLFDGKVYNLHDLSMTVVADLVETPLGTLPGYQISGSNDRVAVSYTFVPELGYLTAYSYGTPDGSEVWESLDLLSVATADTAFWLERGPYTYLWSQPAAVPGAPNATVTTYEMPAGFDELVVAGLGTTGAGVQIRALDTSGTSWGFEDAGGLYDWQVARLTATPGTWALSAYQTADGWAGFEAVAVRWLDLQA